MLHHIVTDWSDTTNLSARSAALSDSSPIYSAGELSVILATLPLAGVVRRRDGGRELRIGDSVTVAELQALEWLSGSDIPDAGPEQSQLYVPQNAGPTRIGDLPPSLRADGHLDILITELPANGTVLQADGVTPMATGQVVSPSQLAASLFVPVPDACGKISLLRYRVFRSSLEIAQKSILVVVGPNVAVAMTALTAPSTGGATIEPLATALLIGAALSTNALSAIAAPADQSAVKSSGGQQPRDLGANVAAVRETDQPRNTANESSVPPKLSEKDAASPVETTSSIDSTTQRSHRIGSSSPPLAGPFLKFSTQPGDQQIFAAPVVPKLTVLQLNNEAGPSSATQFVPVPLIFSSGANSSSSQTVIPPSVTPPVVIIPAAPTANNDSGFVVRHGTITIAASALLANDLGTSGASFSMTGVSDPVNGSVSYDPLTQSVSFVPTVGYSGTTSFKYSITDANGMTASANVNLYAIADESLFGAGAVPGLVTANDPNAVELGVQFTATEDGLISGLRFYKGPDNIGPHVANLWSSSGALLATASFTTETASGWQQVNFTTPVLITAGSTYTASYHTDGNYSADVNYFASPFTNADLTAIGSVYAYGSNSAFPTNSFNNTNYWVDVVYSKLLPAPLALNDGGLLVGENGSIAIADATLLANDSSPNNLPLSFAGVSNPSNGTVSYDAATHAITFVPTAGYQGAASFNYAVTDGGGGVGTGKVNLLVGDLSTQTLFSSSSVPAIASVNDPNSVELGFKFETTANGEITGMRFYKGPDNLGPHVANLWSSTGTLLASATFTNETASGWQQVDFVAPVAVTAGTTYVASYHTDGNYSADPNFFATDHTNGMLIAPGTPSSGGNGVYAYGNSSLFPTNSYNSTGYGVDVLFKAQLTS